MSKRSRSRPRFPGDLVPPSPTPVPAGFRRVAVDGIDDYMTAAGLGIFFGTDTETHERVKFALDLEDPGQAEFRDFFLAGLQRGIPVAVLENVPTGSVMQVAPPGTFLAAEPRPLQSPPPGRQN